MIRKLQNCSKDPLGGQQKNRLSLVHDSYYYAFTVAHIRVPMSVPPPGIAIPAYYSERHFSSMKEDSGFTAELHVVPEHELKGMGIEVDLPAEIGFPVFPHIMLQQGDGDDERQESVVIARDHLLQLFLFFR